MADQENQIVIPEDVVVEEKAFDTGGLTPGEIEMAKKHGLIKEEGEKSADTKQPEPETKEDTGEQAEEEGKKDDGEVEVNTDPSEFEDMDKVFEKNEEKFHKSFTSNQKALYFKSKKYKTRAQEAERELNELKASAELTQLKDSVSAKKLARINEALADPDLTIEKLQAIIAGKTETKEEKQERLTVEEYKEIENKKKAEQDSAQKRYMDRINLAEQIGKSKYDKFDDMVNLAKDYSETDDVVKRVLQGYFLDPNIDEDTLVDKVVGIAKLNPKFKEVVAKASLGDQEKVSRAIDNSKKKKSSASVSGSGSRIITNEDDLTAEDVVKMNVDDYMKLKPSTKRRLLGG